MISPAIDKDIGFTTGAIIGGYPVAVPMVDMHTIGAGGGSIAQVDAGGLLLVGPESAGADPGPACYGKGGIYPTVTDANVVLGRLLSQSFLGGKMQLDKVAAIAAVKTVAEPLGLSVEQAAKGIIDVVNDHMVRMYILNLLPNFKKVIDCLTAHWIMRMNTHSNIIFCSL